MNRSIKIWLEDVKKNELAKQRIVLCALILAFNLTFSNYGASLGGFWLNPLLIGVIIVLTITIALRIA